jgi:hypothetical protein
VAAERKRALDIVKARTALAKPLPVSSVKRELQAELKAVAAALKAV